MHRFSRVLLSISLLSSPARAVAADSKSRARTICVLEERCLRPRLRAGGRGSIASVLSLSRSPKAVDARTQVDSETTQRRSLDLLFSPFFLHFTPLADNKERNRSRSPSTRKEKLGASCSFHPESTGLQYSLRASGREWISKGREERAGSETAFGFFLPLEAKRGSSSFFSRSFLPSF